MISGITKKIDGSFIVQFNGLPYHATEAETPEVFALVQEAILAGEPVNNFIAPPMTPEQQREAWKWTRDTAVANIVVTTTSGRVFDGDEISQARLARAILGLQARPEVVTVKWILANNSVAEVSLSELQEALALAILRQTELWAPL